MRNVGSDQDGGWWWVWIFAILIVVAVIGGAIYAVESLVKRSTEIAVSDEVTMPATVASSVTEIVAQPITVPIDIYDRTRGKVVVEVTMHGDELRVSSMVLDEGDPDTLLLCVKDGGPVRIEGIPDASGVAPEMPEISGTGGAFSCVAEEGAVKGRRVMALLLNESGTEQRVLVTAGLLRAHVVLLPSGHGARNLYWGCDVRPGTAEEGMEGSTVGLWPRPVQDCTEYVMGLSGPVHDRDCPPPCP